MMLTKTTDLSRDPAAGARNLLLGCAGLEFDDTVVLVVEPDSERHYEPELATFIAAQARELGAHVRMLAMAPDSPATEAHPELMAALERADHTIFLNRVGDQLRFTRLPGAGSKTMCYALDMDFLGSDFAVTPYRVWEDIHARVTARLDAARSYRIRCPLGTDLSMRLDSARIAEKRSGGFTVKSFPVMIVPPIPASRLSGRLVLSQALTSTYIHPYDASVLPLPSPLTFTLEDGVVIRIEGDERMVAQATSQFERVGSLFGGAPWAVNSWHAGINAFTFFPRAALSDIDRWSCVAFGSPRYAHFHMCGSAPGDICGQIFDPTISFDEEVLWDAGQPVFLEPAEKERLIAPTGHSLSTFEVIRDLGVTRQASALPG